MTKSVAAALLAALTLAVVPTVFADDAARAKEDAYKDKLQSEEAKAREAQRQAQEEQMRRQEKMKDMRDAGTVPAAEKMPAAGKVQPH